jgi:hypothetical protein
MSNRVIHFFGDVSMSNGHAGLASIASKGRVNINILKPGEFVAFINKRFTGLKLYGMHGVIVHWRADSGALLYQGIISTLPRFLSGADIGFSREIARAIGEHYAEQMGGKGKRRRAA